MSHLIRMQFEENTKLKLFFRMKNLFFGIGTTQKESIKMHINNNCIKWLTLSIEPDAIRPSTWKHRFSFDIEINSG